MTWKTYVRTPGYLEITSALLMAGIWTLSHVLAHGYVPDAAVSNFSMSRWWDVLLIPIFVAFVRLVRIKSVFTPKAFNIVAAIAAVFALVGGPIDGIIILAFLVVVGRLAS
jgi:hypothetical protein